MLTVNTQLPTISYLLDQDHQLSDLGFFWMWEQQMFLVRPCLPDPMMTMWSAPFLQLTMCLALFLQTAAL